LLGPFTIYTFLKDKGTQSTQILFSQSYTETSQDIPYVSFQNNFETFETITTSSRKFQNIPEKNFLPETSGTAAQSIPLHIPLKKTRTSPAALSYCLGFAPNFISKLIISQFPV